MILTTAASGGVLCKRPRIRWSSARTQLAALAGRLDGRHRSRPHGLPFSQADPYVYEVAEHHESEIGEPFLFLEVKLSLLVCRSGHDERADGAHKKSRADNHPACLVHERVAGETVDEAEHRCRAEEHGDERFFPGVRCEEREEKRAGHRYDQEGPGYRGSGIGSAWCNSLLIVEGSADAPPVQIPL